MEKKIQKKSRLYIQKFKDDIIEYAKNLSIEKNDKEKLSQFIYDYNQLEFSEEDFTKRKRVKNIVPLYERCVALRANQLQCTRRKKGESCYCGTHIKGRPHGEVSNKKLDKKVTKTTVWIEDIKGIMYYIDDNGNVYDPQDIIKNKVNPNIIARYEKTGETYHIPSLNKM
mgnify:CR=1 FL=1